MEKYVIFPTNQCHLSSDSGLLLHRRSRTLLTRIYAGYGVSTFVSETGTARSPYRMFSADALNGTDVVDQHLSRVFLNLLRALGKAGSRPREFQVILRHCSLHDHAFHLPKYTEAIVEPVLASIGTMFLDVTTDFYGPYIDTDDQKSECRGYNLRRFLARVPRLQHLRLNLRGRYTEQLFSWFSKRAPGSTLSTKSGPTDLEWPAPVELPNLKQLDLGMITISPESILGIIRKFQSTLRTISLHKVILLDRDREKLSEKVNLWTELFRQLSQLHLELSAMNLSLLSQDVTDRKQPQRVAFNNSRDPKSRKWAGPDVQSGLRDLITDTVIDWAGYDTEGLKSDESGTEDSDGKFKFFPLHWLFACLSLPHVLACSGVSRVPFLLYIKIVQLTFQLVSMEDNDGDEIL